MFKVYNIITIIKNRYFQNLPLTSTTWSSNFSEDIEVHKSLSIRENVFI